MLPTARAPAQSTAPATPGSGSGSGNGGSGDDGARAGGPLPVGSTDLPPGEQHTSASARSKGSGGAAAAAVPSVLLLVCIAAGIGLIRRRRQQDAAGAIPRLHPFAKPALRATNIPTFGAGSGSDLEQDGEAHSVPRSGSVVISNRGMTFAVPMDDEPPQPSNAAAAAMHVEPVPPSPEYNFDECDPDVCYVNGSTSPFVYAIPFDARKQTVYRPHACHRDHVCAHWTGNLDARIPICPHA